MRKDNVNVQSSEEVSYGSLLKSKELLQNREKINLRQIRDVIDVVIQRLGRANLNILEIGFDDGRHLSQLCDIYKDAEFIGLEVRKKTVENMVAQGYDCRLVETELFGDYFESGETFDIIYGFGVLHHMSDPYKSLESLIGILKPDGVITFIREHHRYDLMGHLYATIKRNWAYEKNSLKMKRKRFKELLGKYTKEYFVRYDNNPLIMCFRRLNSFCCMLKLQRFPLINGMTIFARIKSDGKE